MNTIPFSRACQILEDADAVKCDGNLSFPSIYEDCDGEPVIEISWSDNEGNTYEYFFDGDCKFGIGSDGGLVICQDGNDYEIQVLKVAKLVA